jgi:hypothetical protein
MQKSLFGSFFEGLRLEKVEIFYGHLEFYGHLGYFMTIWYIFVTLVHFFRFLYHIQRKIWQPWQIVEEVDSGLRN